MKKCFALVLAPVLIPLFITAQTFNWQARGPGGGGALFSPSVNPFSPNEFSVACDMTELFRTNDFGQSYTLTDFRQLQGGPNAKVCYTSTPGLLYCINYDDDVARPVKSTDNGATWTMLPGNPDMWEDTYSIYADIYDANRVIISYYNGIYYSGDGGTTFTLFHNAANSGAGNVVGGVLFSGDSIFAGTNDGIIASYNNGATWTTLSITGMPANENIFSFAAAKSGNTIRFYCLTGDVNDIYVGIPGSDYWGFVRGVYTSNLGSGAWTSRMNGITAGDYPMFVAMAQNDISTAYLAGSNSNGDPLVMKTTDAGLNWQNVFNAPGNANIATGWCGQGGDRGWGYAECAFGIGVSALDANRVLLSDFGFVHTSSNGGTSWQQAYISPSDQHPAGGNTPTGAAYHSIGLENTTCWQICWSNTNNLFAAYSDIRGTRSTDGGLTWSFNYTGHTANSMYRCVKLANGTLIAATSGIHDMYQSTRLTDALLDANDPQGKLIYSTDNGQTWLTLHTFNHPVFWISLDPNNSNRAYASVIHYNAGNGIGGVYRCDDLQNLAASTWTLLPDPPRTQKHPAALEVLNDGSLVATYSGRRNSAGAFTNSSGVFTYNPTNNGWTDVSAPGMYYWTKDVIIDPNDATQNTWYACVFSGWGGPPNGLGGLYKTTNRGQNWTRINSTDRVTSCTFVPGNNGAMYVTTEQDGLLYCSNVNTASPVFTPVTSYLFRQPERVFFNPYVPGEMWVTSFGNGMQVTQISTGNSEPISQHPDFLSAFPNPVNENVLTIVNNNNLQRAAQLTDVNGRDVLQLSLQNGKNEIDVSALSPGIYFLRSEAEVLRIVIAR
jgi:Secretion system C-terminal sorting domain